ncbi:DUF6442 family protein [Clostridium ljungdahlii]|uniref:DUF2178 domain-containing protein n=1 Tax=Clostridium ljungdahlii TaxID=1538 RepID=A0A168NH00_9CLOT|nr:DUF6442 family protein [Clostridium ljungdahlii]OAA86425.1 hypothetical protein WY13_02414 [Clostridium ljungdahlii]
MKNKSAAMYLVFSLIGFVILAAGAVLAKLTRNDQGIIQTLPYILIGIGGGVFGQNLGTAFDIYTMKKNPEVAKQREIDEKDERNIAIRNKAKAKAYDLMILVFGALMMAFALMGVSWSVVLAIVIAYLFVVFSNIYFISKYDKDM